MVSVLGYHFECVGLNIDFGLFFLVFDLVYLDLFLNMCFDFQWD